MDDRMKTQKHKEVEEELNCYSFKMDFDPYTPITMPPWD